LNIRIVQFNPIVGDILGNADRIVAFLNKAESDHIDLLIFPELSLCGYPPMDLLERKDFIERNQLHIDRIARSTKSCAIIFGAPVLNSGKGRPIFNAAIVAQHGNVLDVIHKTLLPTYDVFDEFRYFEPNKEFRTVQINGIPFGVTICEDIWNNENEIEYHTYEVNPAELLAQSGARVILNISASPFTKNKPELRAKMLVGHAKKLGIPVLYANQVGANTELIFDGDSMAVTGNGDVVGRAQLFEETTIDFLFSNNKIQTKGANAPSMCREERIFKALVLGLRDYMEKTQISKQVVLGLSGGIDSALVAVIAAEAAGANQVHALTMPSEFSSAGSISDSVRLAQNLGIHLDTVEIKNLYESFIGTLNPLFADTSFGVAEENLQSRTRGVLLMALSNKFGYLLLNTGNKSEMAVGYCTLYGDMAGGLSVLSDVYKTEVFAVCRWLNEVYYGKEVIPEAILTKPPSAELRPDQKDTDSLPEYDILDKILNLYIEQQAGSETIIKEIGDEVLVRKVLKLVDMNEYKRRQAAPGLKISAKAFGVGRRLPIVQRWTWQQ
jgi:NAD+ synthetase